MGTGVMLTDTLPAQALRQEITLPTSSHTEMEPAHVDSFSFVTANSVSNSPFLTTTSANSHASDVPQAATGDVTEKISQSELAMIEPLPGTQQSVAGNQPELTLPDTIPAEASSSLRRQSFKVRSGDTLSGIFKKAGFNDALLYAINAGVKEKSWAKIYPGENIEFASDHTGDFAEIVIERSMLENWTIRKDGDGGHFQLQKTLKETDTQTAYAEGTIDSAFFTAAQRAGLTSAFTMELAGLFSWDVDFALDIRQGDSFKVIYEDVYLDGQKIGTGNILAAEFTNQGQTHTAIRFTHANGKASYYDANGNSLKKAFLRSPIDFARISSHFSLNRKHPVLHRFRAHKGTDYAAARGTPIKSTGDGKVMFAGVKSGYGNVVILQHGQGISTLYAHMNGFARGTRSGSRISQGQVVGYVGATGLASGPHLHYEFRVNGVHKNPVTVTLPKAEPVPRQEREAFRKQAENLMARLESFSEGYQVALEDSGNRAPNL